MRLPSWPRCSSGTGGLQEDGLVKRVIALPGQMIYPSANSICVNGRLLAEPYLPHDDPLGPPIPRPSPPRAARPWPCRPEPGREAGELVTACSGGQGPEYGDAP
jgi:Signal peptidase, peptidase S26